MSYDSENIFAKILRGEIPNNTVFENDFVLSFTDINPLCEIHVLVIPKKPYVNASDFIENASNQDISGFWIGVTKTINSLDIKKSGYRLIANTGRDGGQEVEHFHVHILAGESVGPMVSKN